MYELTELTEEELRETTDKERIQLFIEVLEQISLQLEEVQNWMHSDGGTLYPDQTLFVRVIEMLTKSVEESCKNRLDGKDDSAAVDYATKLLLLIHDDSALKRAYLR